MSSGVIDDALKRKLRWVQVSNGRADLSLFPDFLIVGPQRTGTTWLHAHLRYHPEVLLAEPKEIYFFSSLKTRDPKRFVSDQLSWYLQHFREPLWRRVAKGGLIWWKHRRPYAPHVRGEATASYAALDSDVIAEIVALNPALKVILMIRNPIDRAWSHAKKDLLRASNRKIDEVPDHELRAFLSDPYQRRCAQSVSQYENWSSQVRPEHLFVGYFDDLASRPEELLLDVMRFLGVSADRRYIDPSVRRPVNPTEATTIPPQYRALLEELFNDELVSWKSRFGRS